MGGLTGGACEVDIWGDSYVHCRLISPPPHTPQKTTTTQEGKAPDAPPGTHGHDDGKSDEYKSLSLQCLSLDFPLLPLPRLRDFLAEKGGAYFKVRVGGLCYWPCWGV